MNQVKLDTGIISGLKASQNGQEISIFRGIPYAAPPIGDLRWKPPQPAASWTGVRNCTQFSIQAAQFPDIHASEKLRALPSSEDCLYLNVMTPAKKATDKLPVMVWFHGGGTRYGNGNLPISNSLGLPTHGVILVTINHRLGIFSLLAHPLVSRESPHSVSGNYLFLDLIASLEWVKKNIAAFGGDPDNVTIFGQSGGGAKVIAMMTSPLAKGLFHRAIIQSGGNYIDPVYLEDLEKYGERYFTKLGVDKKKDPLAAARALPWQKIVEAEQALNVDLGREYEFMGPWSQVVDGWFMPDSTVNMFQTGKRAQVPYLVVSDLGEITGPALVIAENQVKNYTTMLSSPSKADSRGYAVVFDRVPDNWRQEGCVSAHGMELHYMFGSLDVTEAWEAHYGVFSLSGAKSPMPTLSKTDRNISEAMMKIWTQFAKTGNPGVKGLDWPAWDKAGDQYLLISESLVVKSGFSDLAKIKPIRLSISV
jgi:para-nitrobenzyl esterase